MTTAPASPNGGASTATRAEPRIVTTAAELAEARGALTGRVAVVFTMGALHSGHAALLRTARANADHVLTTIFVNPLQFGPNEDLDRYPRTLDADLAVCAAEGVDVVFAPTTDVMYPGGQPQVRVDPGPLGDVLEGTSRPGFFHGVLTVVLKLCHLTRPDVTFFGEKDYQQLTLVRRMLLDTNLAIEVVGVPTVRDPDGLARSSRNAYLSPAERRTALSLSAALRAAEASGIDGPAAAEAAARYVLDAAAQTEPALRLDYLVLTDPMLGPAPARGPARLLVAAWVGSTRLIDNCPITLGD